MKITFISGGPRKASFTRKLILLAYEYAKKKHKDVELIDLAELKVDQFRGFEEKYSDLTYKTIKLLEKTDVLIIGSPVYNSLLSSALKNLFEHVNYKLLEGKVAGFAIVSGGHQSFLQVHSQLSSLMTYFKVISNPRAVYVVQEEFEGETLKDQEIIKRVEKLVDDTVAMKK